MKKYIVKSVDHLNVQVLERFEKKVKNEEGQWIGTGNFNYKAISYHPNLEKAYKYIIDKEINTADLNDLSSVVNKIKELKEFVKKELSK